MSGDEGQAPPAVCDVCGRPWVFGEPWWREPALIPEWGVLVHCEKGHFAWFAADLSAEELEAAERRFSVSGE